MYQLSVENMSCGHCIAAVSRALKQVDAGAHVEIDLASGPLDKITAAIVEAGYPLVSAA